MLPEYLRFGQMWDNGKLSKRFAEVARDYGYYGNLLTFSLPAGHSCPYARDCLSKADRQTGRITDGKYVQFRCYAATQEARCTNVRTSRWHNYELLRESVGVVGKMHTIRESLIQASAWDNKSVIRWHVSGDFFNQDYFDALCYLATDSPLNLYYAYTKALPYVTKAAVNDYLPSNLRIIASEGGRRDDMIGALRSAKVVYSEDEAHMLDLRIDHDDTIAAFGSESFALLIHGQQPAGSMAGEAVKAIKRAKTLELVVA